MANLSIHNLQAKGELFLGTLDSQLSDGDVSNGALWVYNNNVYMMVAGAVKQIGSVEAESSIETRLSSEEVARASADSSIESAFAAADTSLQTRLSSEEVSRASGDSSLSTRLSDEEVARASGDVSIESRLSSEEVARAAADTSLTTRVSDAEDSREAAINSAITRIVDSAPSQLNTLEEMAEAIDNDADFHGSVDSDLSTLTSATTAAISSRTAADSSLTTRLSSEEVSRTSGDSTLDSRLGTEENARGTADSSIAVVVTDNFNDMSAADSSLIVAYSNADSNLAVAYGNADSSIDSRLASEESAEDAADTSLTTRLSSEEVSRAAADASLTTRLSNEEVVRASADSSLVVVYSAADASLATRLASEESAEDSADTSLTTRLSSEEVAMAAADSSLATDVSSAIVARSSAVSSVMNRFEQVSVNAATAGNFDSNGEKSLTINHSFGNEKALFAMVYVDDVMQMAPVSYNNGSITVDLAGSASGAVCSSDVKVNLVKVVNYSVVTSNLELHLDAGNSSSYSGSGTTWSDLSSNGYDFTLAGSPSHDSGDGSFVFDGNSKRASNSDSISISTGALELWIKVDNDGATGGRVALQGSSHWVSTGDVTGTYNDESLEFNHNSGPTMDYRNGHADFADGTWRHIVSVVDGSDNKLYVDGVAVSTDFRIGNATSTSGKLWDGSAHTIGGFSNGSYTFHGEIAVVRMYSGSFSAANVLNNYNADKARFGH